MKKFLLLFLLIIQSSQAQIGGGWDWAFNTGSLNAATIKHLKYSPDGSEILFGGSALAAAYFNGITYSAPHIGADPGNIQFLGKINSATGIPTILKTFINLTLSFDCITTDDAGNFYTGGSLNSTNPVDLGNGISISGTNTVLISKFDAVGNALWAKTFYFGGVGNVQVGVDKLAVSSSGNIFFMAANTNPDINGKQDNPLYKLDNNGNILWTKHAFNAPNSVNATGRKKLTDQFIDDNENIQLFIDTTESGFTFDGVDHPGPKSPNGPSTLISLNSSGTVTFAKTFEGSMGSYQVNRSNGNIVFYWAQLTPQVEIFPNLPHPSASVNGPYPKSFFGMIETDKNFNFIRTKEILNVIDNPFSISDSNFNFLALPNGKLIYLTGLEGVANASAGTDYLYYDPSKYASAIVETDASWEISKFITGGKSKNVHPSKIAAYGDTYAMCSEFVNAYNDTSPLTTAYGNVTLTGFNAASDYGSYSNGAFLNQPKSDIAFAQTKSANFPKLSPTNWLGNSTDWNSGANWSNGVPANDMKAVFNQTTANQPTVSSSPVAASVEVGIGITVNLPSTLTLKGQIKNDGIINLNNASFFQGFGAKAIKGSGKLVVSGTPAYFLLTGIFENALVLNTDITCYTDLKIPTITFNSGKLNLGGKTLSVTDRSSSAISGTNANSYIYGGPVERKINTTGVYEFPMGNSTKNQTAIIAANDLVGVDKLTTKYTDGAITGTSPNINFNGTTITSALNGGWFSIIPDQQPTGGTYDATLKIQNSTNLSASLNGYTIIKRANSISNWDVLGDYNVATQDGAFISVTNKNLTSFSDFAIGKGNTDIVLSTRDLAENSLQVFPNPTRNLINVVAAKNIKSISVFDVSGKQIQSKNSLLNRTQIDLSAYFPGIYFVRIQLENGEVLTKKIIKN